MCGHQQWQPKAPATRNKRKSSPGGTRCGTANQLSESIETFEPRKEKNEEEELRDDLLNIKFEYVSRYLLGFVI